MKKIGWSNKMAYAVGLLATDGHLSIDKRHIDLTSKDVEQLKNFMQAIGRQYIIAKKSSGYTGELCSRIQFSDVSLYRWLLSIGFKQKKTDEMSDLKIPQKYFFDFLRGHFDGDGSIYSYFDPRWKSSFMYYITFIAKNRDHIVWLQKMIEKLSGVKGRIGLGKRVYQVRFAKKESKVLINKMYKRTDALYLTRKYDKILKILEIDADVL